MTCWKCYGCPCNARRSPDGPVKIIEVTGRDADGVPVGFEERDWQSQADPAPGGRHPGLGQPGSPQGLPGNLDKARGPAERQEERGKLPVGDLLLIVPSRERPRHIRRLLDAVRETSKLATHVHVAVDEDDPCLESYRQVMDDAGAPDDVLETGPRKGLAAWTNEIAVRKAADYPYLASFGDDMVPKTRYWDYFLVRAIEDMGGTGFSYPWDSMREDVPEACVLSSDIVGALGWMCMPALEHFFVDDVWADLGHGAGCIRHLRAVAVDHVHPRAGKAQGDKTYSEASPKLDADTEAYRAWRSSRMADDIAKIIALRENSRR
jgi:hypothetical protein